MTGSPRTSPILPAAPLPCRDVSAPCATESSSVFHPPEAASAAPLDSSFSLSIAGLHSEGSASCHTPGA
eukprot:469065-Amphidinium_carterae.2